MGSRSTLWWKLLGLAGVAGVAATGAVAVRNERRRRNYTPEEIRSVLHERYARATATKDSADELPLVAVPTGLRGQFARLRHRIGGIRRRRH